MAAGNAIKLTTAGSYTKIENRGPQSFKTALATMLQGNYTEMLDRGEYLGIDQAECQRIVDLDDRPQDLRCLRQALFEVSQQPMFAVAKRIEAPRAA